MMERVHLYPCRTQKLSSPMPMVLGPQGPGRVGRCRVIEKNRWLIYRFFSAFQALKHFGYGIRQEPLGIQQNSLLWYFLKCQYIYMKCMLFYINCNL